MLPFKAAQLAELLPRLRSLVEDLEEVARTDGAFIPTDCVVIDRWELDVLQTACLSGRFYGHPTIAEGKLGRTSGIAFVTDDERYVRTLSRWYRLGARAWPEGLQ